MKRHPRVTCYCLACGREFTVQFCELKRGRGKFCSRQCATRSKEHRAAVGKAHQGVRPPNATLTTIRCEVCGKVVHVPPSRLKTARFCSRACQVRKNSDKFRGAKNPRWQRVKMRCEWCGKRVWVKRAKTNEFRFCSRQCQGTATSAKLALHQGATSIEAALMEELTRRDLPFRAQHRIAHWLIDIALPKYKIAVEADGDYWHRSEVQQAKDRKKTHWLEAHRWKVFRFREREIHDSAESCIDQIEAYIRTLPH